MGSRIWLGALVALVVALPGCNSSGDPDDQSKPSDTVAAPEVGTCWRVPADADGDADPSDWFDDSPRVPCTEPHTTETAHVLQLTEPTLAEVKERFSDCWDHVRVYLSVDENSWIPWGYGAWLPSKEQIADGASWMRCDAIFPETWDFAGLRTTADPAAGIADDPPAYMWACLGEHPNKAKQPFVPCDQPHQYEQTGGLAILNNLEQYPSATELATAAKRQCAYAGDLNGEEDGVALTARWDPRPALQQDNSIAGPCFMSNKTGQPLPPL